jgi:hypothetical protein
MRVLFTAGLILSLMAQNARADEARAGVGSVTRCAYLGRCGSFHVIGTGGTAAYLLGSGEFIADLSFSSQDNDYWQFRATNGDPATKFWAFAAHPDNCGRYWVWRYSNGAWRQFESTRAWGEGLGEPVVGSAAAATGPTNQELLENLREIEGRLKAIQPDGRPSLRDLENQIKAKQ